MIVGRQSAFLVRAWGHLFSTPSIMFHCQVCITCTADSTADSTALHHTYIHIMFLCSCYVPIILDLAYV